MILFQADLNHRDEHGRLRLSGLAMHHDTPFREIAARSERILFVDGEDAVYGSLVETPDGAWLGVVDWDTQQPIEAWPPVRVTVP